MADKFKKFVRTQIAEMREVELIDIASYEKYGKIMENGTRVSISEADLKGGSPKKGDMIARNPKNHEDVWLVAKLYFEENFEPNK